MKLLRIDSSARRSSVSRQLTSKFVQEWQREHPEGEVIERDLAITALPLITDEWVQASFTDPAQMTAALKSALAVSDALVAELFAADTIVIGAPMYNFAISAPLKAWIDQVVRKGVTVEFGAAGPVGLLKGKKTFVVTSRGGAFRPGTPTEHFDHQQPYLKHVLGLMGLRDVTFIHAENQKPGQLGESERVNALALIRRAAGASAAL